jgi:hypothetical protein
LVELAVWFPQRQLFEGYLNVPMIPLSILVHEQFLSPAAETLEQEQFCLTVIAAGQVRVGI